MLTAETLLTVFADFASAATGITQRMPKTPAPITGVWLRTGPNGVLQTLVEIDGEWRLLRGNGERYSDGEISHIWESGGFTSAPLDPITTTV